MYIVLQIYKILRFLKNRIIYYFKNTNKYKKSFEYLKSIVDIKTLKKAEGRLRDIQIKSLNFAKELKDILEQNDITPIIAYGSLLGAYRHKGFIPWDDDMDFDLIREDYEKLIKLAQEKYIYIKRPMNRFWSMNKILEFEDNLIRNNPGKLIFIHTNKMLQVYKGTSLKDFCICDFFPLDFYADNYPYKEHLRYIRNIKKQTEKINNYVLEIEYLEQERKSNRNIDANGNNLLYGIDGDPTYTNAMNYGEWLKRDYLYPLIKIKFEDTEFCAPNCPEKFMEHRYGSWKDFPTVIGEPHHIKYIDAFNKRRK